MKKIMNTPDIRIVRFESKDIIVTSDGFATTHDAEGYSETGYEGGYVQGRQSIWD